MRLLLLTTVLPEGRTTGGEVVTQALADALRGAGHELVIAGYRRPGDRASDVPGSVCIGRRPIETAQAPRWKVTKWALVALALSLPFSAAKYRSAAYRRRTRALLHRDRFDLALVDHAQMGWILSLLAGHQLPYVLIAHNVEGQVYAARPGPSAVLRPIQSRERRTIERLERRTTRGARATWTLSEADATYFGLLGPTRLLEPPASFTPAGRTAPKRRAVALIGTWTWGLSRSALEWFLLEVVPRLPRDLDIEIAGRGGDWVEGVEPRVRYRGLVPDAHSFLAEAHVVAVPGVGSTGVQVKTIDAIASGAWVVASPEAARGLRKLPASVRVASSPADFAAAIAASAAAPPREDGRQWAAARRTRFDADVALAVEAALTE